MQRRNNKIPHQNSKYIQEAPLWYTHTDMNAGKKFREKRNCGKLVTTEGIRTILEVWHR